MAWRPVRPLAEWRLEELTTRDFAAAAASAEYGLYKVSGNEVIEALMVEVVQNPAGGAITSAHIDVGIPGDLTKYIDSMEVLRRKSGFKDSQSTAAPISPEIDQTVVTARLRVVGGNTEDLSSGSFRFYIKVARVPFRV